MENNVARYDELKAKGKLTPTEKGELASLERVIKKQQKAKVQAIAKSSSNLFGKVATTNITPKPVRFLETEITALQTRRDTLKSDHADLIIRELGSLREVNDTKLIRAALVLLMKTGDEEVIAAIKEVQMKMIRGNV